MESPDYTFFVIVMGSVALLMLVFIFAEKVH